MRYIKMFIAGLALPSFLLPFLFLAVWCFGRVDILTSNPFSHFIPLIWGVWNIIALTWLTDLLPGSTNSKLLLTGAILGLIIALCGVFWLKIPSLLGFSGAITYLPLIVAPIIYALLWRFVVDPINHLLQVRH